MKNAFVHVALPLPLRQTFTYRLPEELIEQVVVGSTLLVPFRQKTLTGYAVGLSSEKEPGGPGKLKSVTQVIDRGPLFPSDLLSVTRWMADYYLCGWGEVLRAAVPDKGAGKKRRVSDIEDIPLPDELMVEAEPERFSLSTQQKQVLEPLLSALGQRQYMTAVLHGVTASGKTAVYEELVAKSLEMGREAIVLVPEISITPQMVALFRTRFGSSVTLFHSRLKPKDRYLQWRRVLSGEASVVIGPRSAVLAPVKNPGVIIVDEEHESSYKQSEPAPRYHARDVAVYRARESGAICVLGSATPSSESYSNALEGKYHLLEMPERIDARPLPQIHLVDIAAEPRPKKGGSLRIFSRMLEEGIAERLEREEQVILFLNRRGFSPALTCADCGSAEECTNCSVAMTYHRREGHLRCHYCGAVRNTPTSCSACGGKNLRYQGLGTQRVEAALLERFPGVNVLRMDSDSTRKRGSHGELYRAFASGDGDVLLGTQMVAKGFHFPSVTMVGVVSADAELHFPDFRANERTFQLLTQVAGRAGRGLIGGEVVIQTFAPDNPGVTYAVSGDYKGFIKEELKSRKLLSYPPYGRMVRVLIRSRKEEDVLLKGKGIAEKLKAVSPPGVIVLGPAPAPLYRLNRWYRVHIFLRGSNAATLRKCIERAEILNMGRTGLVVIVDVDPIDVL